MSRFFINDDPVRGAQYTIIGESASHISRSLRMRIGEKLTLCNGKGVDFICEIASIDKLCVMVKVLEIKQNAAEPLLQVTLFQALPKGDKLETIVQKAVELGAVEIVPVLTERCISRPDYKGMEKRVSRLNQISLEAAKQSGRGLIPKVLELLHFEDALQLLSTKDLSYICYEHEEERSFVKENGRSAGIFIGPEGGFSKGEIEKAKALQILPLSLGKRILRTETAGVSALSVLMYLYQ